MKRVQWTEDGWFVDVAGGKQRLSEDQVSFLQAAVAAAKDAKEIDDVRPEQEVTFNAQAEELSRRLRWDAARVLRVSGELMALGLVNYAPPPRGLS